MKIYRSHRALKTKPTVCFLLLKIIFVLSRKVDKQLDKLPRDEDTFQLSFKVQIERKNSGEDRRRRESDSCIYRSPLFRSVFFHRATNKEVLGQYIDLSLRRDLLRESIERGPRLFVRICLPALAVTRREKQGDKIRGGEIIVCSLNLGRHQTCSLLRSFAIPNCPCKSYPPTTFWLILMGWPLNSSRDGREERESERVG